MGNYIDPILLFSISLLVIYNAITKKPKYGYVFDKKERFLVFLKMSAQYLRGIIHIYTIKPGYKLQKKIELIN
jgi:hypothetical protein